MKSVLSEACTIKLKNFEGPFDLLFFLIEKNELDIYDIPINDITDQYMDYLFAMQELNLEIASEFLVMASTLLHIKSRLLLPNRKEEEADEIDPREELILRLVEYKKYKEFARLLKDKEVEWARVHYKLPEPINYTHQEELLDLSSVELRNSFIRVINIFNSRKNDDSKKMSRILEHEKVSLKSKIKELICFLQETATICFSNIFNVKERSRLEVATGFLAILELAKLRKASIEQKEEFGEIYIVRREEMIK